MSQTVEQILEQLRSDPIVRTFAIDREAIDEDKRTINLAFASDDPIDHWFGRLELSMDPKHMRTERLKAGAPLLMGHESWNWRSQVGVVDKHEIGPDRVARADVRFSRSKDGEEVYQDVLDGIRQQVSVGFFVHGMDLVKKVKNGPDIYRSEDWEPFEISLVPVAADFKKAGVGRSDQKLGAFQPLEFSTPDTRAISTTERNTMKNEDTPVTPAVETPAQPTAATRHREVLEWADIFNEGDLARELLLANPDAGVDDVRLAIKAKRDKAVQTPTLPPMDPQTAAERNGGPRAELARTLPRHGAINFKGEDGPERAYRFGQWLLGRALFDPEVPVCVAARKFCDTNGITRAMSEGVNEAGGYTVPTEFSNDIIDLREMYGVFRRNAKIVPMGSDTLLIPRRVSGLTPYFVAEGGSITASDKAWDQVQLVAQKLAVLARYSSEVNEDSIIAFASDLASEIAYAFANKEDECGFNGDGTSTYGGMTGVRQRLLDLYTVTGGVGLKLGTGNAYSELTLTDFEGTVGLLPEYADTESAAWFVHRSFYWNVMVRVMLASGGVTAAEIEDARKQRYMGYRVVFSQVMPKTEANGQVCALLGDLAKAAILGSRRETQIATSEHSRFANDQIEIRGTERFHINVHSYGDATNAGPVVGLLTANS